MATLSREQIVHALARLNQPLATVDTKADLYLVGGAVMFLVHRARPSTKDVDGWFTEPQVVRTAARGVARELALDGDWLNDAAKGFVPANAGYEAWQSLSHLTIATADTRTLLAMKCAAVRTETDTADIRVLAAILGLRSSAAVLAGVSSLCREVGMDSVPGWLNEVHSPEPFFVIPARGFALRVRLLLKSPPAFRCRNVFVPENDLSRA